MLLARYGFLCANNSGPAVGRQGLRRTFLKVAPDDISNVLLLAAQARVPETQDSYAPIFKPGIPFSVQFLSVWISMLRAIQLDIQVGFRAKEIKNV